METYLPTLTVAGVLGFLAPLLASALNKMTFSSRVKQIVAVCVSALMAVIALAVTGGFGTRKPGEDPIVYWLLVVFAVIAVAQIAYALLWKPVGADSKIAVATSTSKERTTLVQNATIPGTVMPFSVASPTLPSPMETLDTPSPVLASTVNDGWTPDPDAEVDATPVAADYTPKHTA